MTEKAAPAWTAWAFAGATLIGAFLLFQIQPLISKFILPWLGGAPAVWTTCMLFFQIVLFGGYAYSHLLVSRLGPRGQAIAQCLLLLAAIAVLPIAPSASWKPADSSAPTFRILLVLTADDVIAIHTTNTYLYLFPVARALAEDADRGWRRVYMPLQGFRYRSDWVLISKNQSFLDAVPNIPPPPERHEPDFANFPVWTDQNNNQFRILVGAK